MPIIELDSVSKVFGFGDATTIALDDVNLRRKGRIYCHYGPERKWQKYTYECYWFTGPPARGWSMVVMFHAYTQRRPRQSSAAKRIGFTLPLDRLTHKGITNVRRLHRASELLDKVV